MLSAACSSRFKACTGAVAKSDLAFFDSGVSPPARMIASRAAGTILISREARTILRVAISRLSMMSPARLADAVETERAKAEPREQGENQQPQRDQRFRAQA